MVSDVSDDSPIEAAIRRIIREELARVAPSAAPLYYNGPSSPFGSTRALRRAAARLGFRTLRVGRRLCAVRSEVDAAILAQPGPVAVVDPLEAAYQRSLEPKVLRGPRKAA